MKTIKLNEEIMLLFEEVLNATRQNISSDNFMNPSLSPSHAPTMPTYEPSSLIDEPLAQNYLENGLPSDKPSVMVETSHNETDDEFDAEGVKKIVTASSTPLLAINLPSFHINLLFSSYVDPNAICQLSTKNESLLSRLQERTTLFLNKGMEDYFIRGVHVEDADERYNFSNVLVNISSWKRHEHRRKTNVIHEIKRLGGEKNTVSQHENVRLPLRIMQQNQSNIIRHSFLCEGRVYFRHENIPSEDLIHSSLLEILMDDSESNQIGMHFLNFVFDNMKHEVFQHVNAVNVDINDANIFSISISRQMNIQLEQDYSFIEKFRENNVLLRTIIVLIVVVFPVLAALSSLTIFYRKKNSRENKRSLNEHKNKLLCLAMFTGCTKNPTKKSMARVKHSDDDDSANSEMIENDSFHRNLEQARIFEEEAKCVSQGLKTPKSNEIDENCAYNTPVYNMPYGHQQIQLNDTFIPPAMFHSAKNSNLSPSNYNISPHHSNKIADNDVTPRTANNYIEKFWNEQKAKTEIRDNVTHDLNENYPDSILRSSKFLSAKDEDDTDPTDVAIKTKQIELEEARYLSDDNEIKMVSDVMKELKIVSKFLKKRMKTTDSFCDTASKMSQAESQEMKSTINTLSTADFTSKKIHPVNMHQVIIPKLPQNIEIGSMDDIHSSAFSSLGGPYKIQPEMHKGIFDTPPKSIEVKKYSQDDAEKDNHREFPRVKVFKDMNWAVLDDDMQAPSIHEKLHLRAQNFSGEVCEEESDSESLQTRTTGTDATLPSINNLSLHEFHLVKGHDDSIPLLRSYDQSTNNDDSEKNETDDSDDDEPDLDARSLMNPEEVQRMASNNTEKFLDKEMEAFFNECDTTVTGRTPSTSATHTNAISPKSPGSILSKSPGSYKPEMSKISESEYLREDLALPYDMKKSTSNSDMSAAFTVNSTGEIVDKNKSFSAMATLQEQNQRRNLSNQKDNHKSSMNHPKRSFQNDSNQEEVGNEFMKPTELIPIFEKIHPGPSKPPRHPFMEEPKKRTTKKKPFSKISKPPLQFRRGFKVQRNTSVAETDSTVDSSSGSSIFPDSSESDFNVQSPVSAQKHLHPSSSTSADGSLSPGSFFKTEVESIFTEQHHPLQKNANRRIFVIKKEKPAKKKVSFSNEAVSINGISLKLDKPQNHVRFDDSLFQKEPQIYERNEGRQSRSNLNEYKVIEDRSNDKKNRQQLSSSPQRMRPSPRSVLEHSPKSNSGQGYNASTVITDNLSRKFATAASTVVSSSLSNRYDRQDHAKGKYSKYAENKKENTHQQSIGFKKASDIISMFERNSQIGKQ